MHPGSGGGGAHVSDGAAAAAGAIVAVPAEQTVRGFLRKHVFIVLKFTPIHTSHAVHTPMFTRLLAYYDLPAEPGFSSPKVPWTTSQDSSETPSTACSPAIWEAAPPQLPPPPPRPRPPPQWRRQQQQVRQQEKMCLPAPCSWAFADSTGT